MLREEGVPRNIVSFIKDMNSPTSAYVKFGSAKSALFELTTP